MPTPGIVNTAEQVDAPDGVVLPVEGVKQQGVWVQESAVPFQVDVCPAVVVVVEAPRHDVCEVADLGFEPFFVIQ